MKTKPYRESYRDLPEPKATPCPVRPEVVERIKQTVLITEALWTVSEQYHAGAITHAEFGARNRALWDRAAQAGVSDDVTRRLRDAS